MSEIIALKLVEFKILLVFLSISMRLLMARGNSPDKCKMTFVGVVLNNDRITRRNSNRILSSIVAAPNLREGNASKIEQRSYLFLIDHEHSFWMCFPS